jgi:hypothetical protein
MEGSDASPSLKIALNISSDNWVRHPGRQARERIKIKGMTGNGTTTP